MRIRAAGWALAGALLCAFGCAQPIEGACPDGGHPGADGGHLHDPDGGQTGGGGGDGGMNGGADGGGGGADGGSTDAGEVFRGDAGIFTWGTMPGMFVDEEVNAVHGASGEMPYIATSKGRVYRWSAASWQVAWLDSSSFGRSIRGLYVTPSGKVFAGGSNVLLHCTGPECTQTGNFTETTMTGNLAGTVYGVCGRGEDQIYAVGYSSADGRVFRFDTKTSTWSTYVADTGTSWVYGCWVAPDGTVYATSTNGRMIRVDNNGIAYVELANSTVDVDAKTTSFRAVHGAGGRVFATGSSRRIIERDPATKTWNFVFAPSTGTSEMHHAMGGGAADEIFAGGEPFTDRRLVRYDGTEWKFLRDMEGSLTFSVTITGIWAAGPDEIYLSGHKTYDGVVVRGVR